MTVNTRTRAITALALTGALLGGGALTAAPASAAPIPPGCTIRATSTAAHTKCLDMAHRAAVKCTGDNWHFGDWVDPGFTSIASCASGDVALDHSIDLHE
ncbi:MULTISPECIES: hypothetical protein [Nocardiopsis]|jgi:hypothetical protein|uniref:hypothetical protein n=1 Tax=Nocardiopsis TaxID=2013 RepID=UPI0005A95B07|nr:MULTISPECIES: hypothetical protein [Nocardiopsis]MEC3891263.1 hypothetical protein [Nocardiopsis sp. LDBS1602]